MTKNNTPNTVRIPEVLTAKTWFWNPGNSVNQRRENEEKYAVAVYDFVLAIGFELNDSGLWERHYQNQAITIEFDYAETANNVYRTLRIWRDGKKSNMSIIKKIAAEFAGKQ